MNLDRINKICAEEFGAGICAIGSTCALWLAEMIFEQHGENVFREIAGVRERHGLGTMFPAYRSPLFLAMNPVDGRTH